jgi:hypothetical protein
MMSKSLIRRLERVERQNAAAPGRIRFIWRDWGESDESVQARIRARIERGEIDETDTVRIFRWHEPEGGWPPKDDRWENQNVHAVAARAAERARASSTQANPTPEPQGPVRTVHEGPDPTAPCPEYPP